MKSIKEIFSFFKKKEEPKKIQPKERKDHSLERFVDAQERMYNMALTEVKSGKKLSHWIWYIFPQLKGLGKSNNSIYYGIDDIEEAKAYLQHPVLGARLREITEVFLQSDKSAKEIFGGLDAMKVCSCMTLFNEVSDDDLFEKVLEKHYNGEKDEITLYKLKKQRFTAIELNKINYKNYLPIDMIAFSFAEGGAQGDAGGLIIISEEKKIFYLNLKWTDWSNEIDVICPILKKCRFDLFNSVNVPENWFYNYMGGGNHLVIHKSLQSKFEEKTIDMDSWDLYDCWLDVIFDLK